MNIAILFAIIGMFCGIAVLCRFPRLPSPSLPAGTSVDCTVIIPARNESRHIGRTVESFRDQTCPPQQILVADDGSTDDTAARARAHGAAVVSITEKPQDWTGKTFALHSAAQQVRTRYLLFCDADVSAAPDLLQRLLSSPPPSRSILSVQPHHRVHRPYEQLSLFFNILILMGTGGCTIAGRHVAPSGSFGPFILMNTADYRSIDGHRSVKGAVLEHLSLGRRLRQDGYRQILSCGHPQLQFRMYPNGPASLIEGWTKGFASGAGATRPWFMLPAILWISGWLCLVPAWLTAGSQLTLTIMTLVTLALVGHGLLVTRKAGTFAWWNVCIFPLHALFFLALFTWSLLRIHLFRRVTWKGREIEV